MFCLSPEVQLAFKTLAFGNHEQSFSIYLFIFNLFYCSGTTTSLFGYKLTTSEAVAALIRLKKDICSLPKTV